MSGHPTRCAAAIDAPRRQHAGMYKGRTCCRIRFLLGLCGFCEGLKLPGGLHFCQPSQLGKQAGCHVGVIPAHVRQLREPELQQRTPGFILCRPMEQRGGKEVLRRNDLFATRAWSS